MDACDAAAAAAASATAVVEGPKLFLRLRLKTSHCLIGEDHDWCKFLLPAGSRDRVICCGYQLQSNELFHMTYNSSSTAAWVQLQTYIAACFTVRKIKS